MENKEKRANKQTTTDKEQQTSKSEYAEVIKQIIHDSNEAAHGRGEYATYEEVFGEDRCNQNN